jgi:hypothetical protein
MPTRTVAHTAVAVALLAGLVLAGCGSSSKSAAAGGPAAKTSAATYVGDVCGDVDIWLHAVQSHSADIASELAPGSTPAKAKQALEALVTNSVQDSEAIVVSLGAAGTPDVPEGPQVASALRGAFQRASSALARVQAQVQALPTSDPKTFLEASKHISSDVQNSLSGISAGLNPLHSHALQKAAESSPACKTLGAG